MRLKKFHHMVERDINHMFFTVSCKDKIYDHQKIRIQDSSRYSCTIECEAFKRNIKDSKYWKLSGSRDEITLTNKKTGEVIHLHRET